MNFLLLNTAGRRRELIVSAVMYLVGALLTALAPNFVIMVIGRFIYGIGIGLVRLCFYNPPSFPLQVSVRVLSLW